MKRDSQTNLGKSSYLTLILRLALDADGRVRQGACVAMTGEVIATFSRLEELPVLIESVLHQQVRAEDDNLSEI